MDARSICSIIHLLDNALSPALLKALAADPSAAPWYGFARVTAHLADPDFCMRLRDAGCAMLQLGLESGDQGVLNALNKGIDLSTASAVLKNLRSAGIETYVYLLFGTPAETGEAAGRTMKFIIAHSEENGAGTGRRSGGFWRRNSSAIPRSRRSSAMTRPTSPRTMRRFS